MVEMFVPVNSGQNKLFVKKGSVSEINEKCKSLKRNFAILGKDGNGSVIYADRVEVEDVLFEEITV